MTPAMCLGHFLVMGESGVPCGRHVGEFQLAAKREAVGARR